MPTEPLSGLRVLDLGTFIAAPFCGTLLAEFGAEVLKVEDPSRGDSLRTLGEECRGVPLLWLQEARNKHAITCNLREPGGQAVIRDLVRGGYTIVLENFRPGTLERWNLGYDRLSALDPGVIMVRITGFGQDGPARDRPGFGRIAIKGCRVAQGNPNGRFLAFRAQEGVNQRPQPIERRPRPVTEDRRQQPRRLPPFVALQAEQDRALVGKILVQRPDADARPFRDAGRGKSLRSLLLQNLNSSLENGLHQLVRTRLLGRFS